MTIQQEYDEVSAWRRANLDKIGTVEFRQATLTHALLNAVLALNGGMTAEQVDFVTARRAGIDAGTHRDSW